MKNLSLPIEAPRGVTAHERNQDTEEYASPVLARHAKRGSAVDHRRRGEDEKNLAMHQGD